MAPALVPESSVGCLVLVMFFFLPFVWSVFARVSVWVEWQFAVGRSPAWESKFHSSPQFVGSLIWTEGKNSHGKNEVVI